MLPTLLLGALAAAQAPDTLHVPLVVQDRVEELALRPVEVRDPDARLWITLPGGRTVERRLPDVTALRGEIVGAPGSRAHATLASDGLRVAIEYADGRRHTFEPDPASGEPIEVAPLETPACGGDFEPMSPAAASTEAPAPNVAMRPRRDCMRRFQIAYDADFEYFLAKGSVEAVIATVDLYTNQVGDFYARDLMVDFITTGYVVRTTPFYAPSGGGDLLDLFRAEWNANQGHVPRDAAHLMTGKPGSLIEFGGLAWVSVVCNLGLAYGWSMDSAGIVGHEVGHNFGSGHCHDETPCNNMCGACLYIGPQTKDIKLGYLAGVGCLDVVEPYDLPLAPYDHPDATSVVEDALAPGDELLLDPLANDHDGNCEPLMLATPAGVSSQGGAVSVEPGFDGRDRLRYQSPTVPFIGVDELPYEIVDESGLATAATFRVERQPMTSRGYYRLDEGVGTVAGDASAAGNDGTLFGAPAWTAGLFGGALSFDGVDDWVEAAPLGGTLERLTFSAWVRPDGTNPWSGLFFTRGTHALGLHLLATNQLRLNWNGVGLPISTGLVAPDGQWSFVAVVVEPDRATFYLDSGAGLESFEILDEFPPLVMDDALYLGLDPGVSTRLYRGELDDVRLFDAAFTPAAIAALADGGGPSLAPSPEHGSTPLLEPAALAWASPVADLYEVYGGVDFAAVAAAGPGSPEHLGSTTSESLAFSVPTDVTFHWRVDRVLGGVAHPGQPWLFRHPRVSAWSLDELVGPWALGTASEEHGLFTGDPLLGEPGASASTGSSVRFDGSGDAILVATPLDLFTDALTISAWVRRDGSQSPFSGIVFSRDASTTAGLNFGEANELRYHWNNSGSTWGFDSGLVVPDDTWVFCALVVAPDRAELYLGDAGVLTSATNPVGHGIEEFDGQLQIGQDPTGGRYFDGWLDQVRIHRGAMTAAELSALYLSEL